MLYKQNTASTLAIFFFKKNIILEISTVKMYAGHIMPLLLLYLGCFAAMARLLLFFF